MLYWPLVVNIGTVFQIQNIERVFSPCQIDEAQQEWMQLTVYGDDL